MSDQALEPQQHKGHPKEYHFFVDGTRYDVAQSSITGADVKRIANVDPSYQVFLEGDGGGADELIADTTGVDLTHGAKHFYTAPPATFGGE